MSSVKRWALQWARWLPPTAPSVAVSAPVNVATVMEAWYEPLCVAVTLAFVRMPLDTACQTSAVPN